MHVVVSIPEDVIRMSHNVISDRYSRGTEIVFYIARLLGG